jgi:4-hydroxyproline epimerase
VTIENVPSFCHSRNVEVQVPGVGRVVGDVAWGGNWFFITHDTPIAVTAANAKELIRVTQAIQDAINAAGITGANGEPIDHIEISAAPTRADADCRNFVLCSGGEYDRSPCGTGTSAKLAVLYAKGEITLGTRWRQESITGSLFTGWLTTNERGELIPHIRGTAYITAEATLLFDQADPFRGGIPSA